MNRRRPARYLTSKRAHQQSMQKLEHMHQHQLEILERMNIMSAAMDRLTAEVAETKTAIDSALTLIAGLAQQIRDAATDPAALNALADELDAKQAEIAAAVTENTPPTT